MSKLETFEKLIKDSYFKATLNTNVIVKTQNSCNENFPISSCSTCVVKFKESGLLDSVKKVHWGLVGASTYNLEEKVSHILANYVC